MSVSLPADLNQFVDSALASGRYPSMDAVVIDGLRLLQERERQRAALRAAVLPAVERLDRGEGIVVEEDQLDAFFDDLIERGLKRLETGRETS